MTDTHWQALKTLMGHPAWAEDGVLDTAEGRQQAAHLDGNISAWTRTFEPYDLMSKCQAAGVPAGVVQTGRDLAENDPQLAHHGFLTDIDEPHPTAGALKADRLPLYFSKTPCDEYRRPREVGEDNAAVLADWLGMSEDEVRRGESDGYLS